MFRHGPASVVRALCVVLAAILAISTALVAAPFTPTAAAAPGSDRPAVHMTFAADGTLTPASVSVVVGQSVLVDNDSPVERSVVADDGTFDSGPIPSGGTFAVTLSVAGAVAFSAPGEPEQRGLIDVGLTGLAGMPSDKVVSMIPAVLPPAATDLTAHLRLIQRISRTRLLVAPTTTATVGAFNDLLAANHLTIIGGLPTVKLLVVATADPGDHSAVTAAATALRASNQVAAASLDFEVHDRSIPRPVPTPSSTTDPLLTYLWNDPAGKPTTADGNWGLRDIRAPQAWNLIDAGRGTNQPATVAVLENGFGRNDDVPFVEIVDECWVRVGIRCASKPNDDHGLHTSGIVGARHDNAASDAEHTTGTTGVDPLSRLYGVIARLSIDDFPGGDNSLSALASILDQMLKMTDPGGKLAGLRAINISLGAVGFDDAEVLAWWAAHPYNQPQHGPTVKCGPGAGDDGDAALATKPCYPGTEDGFRTELTAVGKLLIPILTTAASKNVILVNAAGNDRDAWCLDHFQPTQPGVACLDGFDTLLDSNVHILNEFAIAADLSPQNPDPLLVVENHTINGTPNNSSQLQGDISAPGTDIVSTIQLTKGEYGPMTGTSMAAPLVAGSISYLYSLRPSADWKTYRQVILDSATPGQGGGAKHLDLYGAVVKLNLLKSAADLNDWSADGDRRVFRSDFNTPIGLDTAGSAVVDGRDTDLGPKRAQPDGKVDMRDFRAMRDAWLKTCVDGSAGTQAGSAPACPAQITLDGPADHLKKDGNGDRCVTTPTSNCQASETAYSRFDANGDGHLSVYDKAPVNVDAQGRPATSTAQLTDLDVLQTYFETNTANTEGWAKGELANLLVSADLEVRLGDLWAAGATSVKVTTTVEGQPAGKVRTFAKPTSGPGGGIVTVPVAPDGSTVELLATATGPGGTPIIGTPVVVGLAAGEDAVASPCVATIDLALGAPALLPGKETSVTGRIRDCNMTTPRPELTDRPMTFAVAAAGSDVPVITSAPTVPTDDTGTATATLRAGDGTGTFTVSAKVDLGGGNVLTATKEFKVSAQITMAYKWRSTLDTYNEHGTTRFPGQPDCTTTGARYCLDAVDSVIEPQPNEPAYVVERSGTLTATKDGVILSERVDEGSAVLRADFTWQDLERGTTDTGFKRYWFGIAAPDQFRYTNTPVPVTITPSGDDVVVDNLRVLATLGYRGVITGAQAYHLDPKEIGIPSDFFLTPRTDGSSIAFAPSPYAALRFTPANPSGVAGYDWCGTNTTDLTEPPGYYAAGESPWVIGATEIERDEHYDAGDQPLLTTTGTLRFDVAFASTISIGGTPPAPELPTCDGPNPPDAEFKVINPAPIEEGEAVQFVDRSEDVDGDIAQWAWDFGGTGASTAQDPTYSAGFPDEGTYPVRLTVTDAQGHAGTIVKDVVVVNGAPSVSVAKPVMLATAQVPTTVVVYPEDPGEHDRRALKVTLSSSNTAFGAARTVSQASGEVRFNLTGLAAGDYPLTVTVADDQNATGTATAMLFVSPVPPQPVEAPVPPAMVRIRGCTAPLPLDTKEADLLARINGQRANLGVAPLIVSNELTSAAQAHARDLLASGTVSGVGSDGISATDRARNAGYPKGAALDARVADAPDSAGMWNVLRSGAGIGEWFASGMAMLGIAHVTDGNSTRWVVVAGSDVDCDEQPPVEGSAPVAAVDVPTTPVAEGITFTVADASTDPDGDIASRTVDWGDGTGQGGLAHRFADDGTYNITVTVTDESGHVSTATAPVVVTSSAPEVAITPTTLVAGETGLVAFSVVDLAEGDRPLTLTFSSDPPGLAPASPYTTTAGSHVYKVTPPRAEPFTLTLTATDPDGASASTTQQIQVVAGPAPEPTPPANVTLPPAPTCATGMVVRGQVAEQLALLNAYRARHGIGPLVVVPQLTVAAQRHVDDMIAKRFFAHQGSDGTMPAQRAAAAGYQGMAGENLGLRSATAAAQLAGWIMSPPHHANLLDPTWKAIGIAAGNGQDGVLWANVFGDRITCPPASQTAPEPIVLENPVVAAPAGTLGVGAADSGPIAPVAEDTELLAPTETEAAAATSVVAPATTAAPTATAMAVAFVVSDRTPSAGQVITVVNRTRDHGVARVATMTTSSMPPSAIAADATRRLTVLDPGALRIDLAVTMVGGSTLTVGVPLTVAGDPQAPTISLVQPAPVVSGELLELVADVRQPGGAPAGGRAVRFELNGSSVTTATGDDGSAHATIRADVPAGAWTVRAVVLTDAGAVAAATDATVQVAADNAPVAAVGGPYSSNIGDALTLDGSGSYDVDGEGLDYAWDLDGDGQFDDANGPAAEVEWPVLEQLVCGGACDADVAHPIGLRTTDPRGASDDDATTLTFTRDFRVVVSPATLTIVPGSSNSFVVDVATTSGFADDVTLTATGLPAGATAKFDPAVVTPGTPSTLTVTLPADVGGVEEIDLAVTGTSGSLVRTAAPVVDVVFGLPPRCSTSVEGVVLDAETHLPIAGAKLRISAADGTRNLVSDGNGRWRIAAVSPSTTNQPGPVTRRIELDGYWFKDLKATATCGVPMVLEDQLIPVHTVHVTGRVHVGQQDPQNITKITPTDAVAPGTTFAITNGSTKLVEATAVGGDGRFAVDVPLSYENKPANYTIQGIAPGYWPNNFGLPAIDGDSPSADIVIIAKCTARITGGRTVDETGKPVAGVKVTSSTAGKSTTSAADGSFRLDADLTLGVNNAPSSASIAGTPPADRPDLTISSTNATLGACGDVVNADIVMRKAPVAPPVVVNRATITGTVTDVESKLPIANATVAVNGGGSAKTAADGTVTIAGVLVGYNSTDVAAVNVVVSEAGHWSETVTLTIRKDQTSTFTQALTPKRTGVVAGVVRDQVSGAPLPGAKVAVASQPTVTADGEGRFSVANVPLGQRNTPKLTTVSATLAGYWPRSVTVQATDGATATAEVAMLQECATAEVRGVVVNAATRQPINGARVAGSGATTAFTGADGRFAITGIRMQTNNTPWALSLTASATGFVSQTRTINVFCGARIEVGFGSLPASPAVLTGTVTDSASGAPLADVFVGTGFGGAARTAADGTYRIEGVPTNDDGTPATWDVTVVPAAGDAHLPATAAVEFGRGATVTKDFALDLPAPPNQPPAAVVATPPAVAEGSPVTLDASASSDPEGAALAFAWDLDGDGLFDDAGTATATFTPPVAGSYAVAVRVTDPDGVSAVATATLVAQNVPPTVDAGSDVTLDVAGHLVRNGTFGDPGADSFSATVDLGEGAGAVPLPLAGTGFALDHVFGAGTWNVTVAVCDGHGGCGQDTFAVTVPSVPPNQAPVAVAVSAATTNDTSVAVTLAGADPDGDAITYQVMGAPAHGTLSGTAPNLSYKPAVGFVGTDTFSFTVSDGRLTSAPATATVTVTASTTTRLLISDDPMRSVNVRSLDGQKLRNGAPMYVFVGPAAVVPTIKQVRFYLDDPQRTGTPFALETSISWDFARTAANSAGCTTCSNSPAHPFESNLLSLGTHTIGAVVEYRDGRPPTTLTASFTVADTTPHSLVVSAKPDRGGATALDGATFNGKRYIFLGAADDVIAGQSSVRFVLDGKAMITETLAPYDLMATAANGTANALDTKTLSTGTHTLVAFVQLPEGVTYKYTATFTVTR